MIAAMARHNGIYGTVVHPTNLRPAIDALSEKGKRFLEERCRGREIKAKDIAKAADFERGEYRGG